MSISVLLNDFGITTYPYLKKHIPKKAKRWYRRHLEEYIAAHPKIKLPNQSAQHIEIYLTGKGRQTELIGWHFRQIVDALMILFCDMLNIPWAKEYDWNRWIAFAREPDGQGLLSK